MILYLQTSLPFCQITMIVFVMAALCEVQFLLLIMKEFEGLVTKLLKSTYEVLQMM